MLADEPTGNLDPATGLAVLETLRELQRAGHQTLLMVTHNPHWQRWRTDAFIWNS